VLIPILDFDNEKYIFFSTFFHIIWLWDLKSIFYLSNRTVCFFGNCVRNSIKKQDLHRQKQCESNYK